MNSDIYQPVQNPNPEDNSGLPPIVLEDTVVKPILDNEPEPIAPNHLRSESQSVYFKIARAVDGDDWWITRLKTAFEIMGIEDTRQNFVKVTKAVADKISCLVDGTVDTSSVTDEDIDAALDTL